MDLEQDNIIRPVATEENQPLQTTGFHKYTKFIRFLASLGAVLSLLASGWCFAGFAENDQGIWHLLFALAFCFGLGALAYGPLFYTARQAHISLQSVDKGQAIIAFIFFVPWLILSALLIRLGGQWIGIGVTLSVMALFILVWGILVWRHPQA